MTTNTPPPAEFPSTGLDQWLDHGMNEITEAMATVLDISTGLHAILPHIADDHAADVKRLRTVARQLASYSLRERLELRFRTSLDELYVGHRIAEVFVKALDLALILDHNDASDFARDLNLHLNASKNIWHSIRDLMADCNLIEWEDPVGDLSFPPDCAHALMDYLELARKLASRLARDPYVYRNLDPSLARELDLTRDRAAHRAAALIAALTDALEDILADALVGEPGLARVLDVALTTDVPRALDHAEAYGRTLIETIGALDAAITDFTTADLHGINLRGVNLRGIRWSTLTTQWPAGWHDPIKEASVQTNPVQDPDLYVIRDDPRLPIIVLDTERR